VAGMRVVPARLLVRGNVGAAELLRGQRSGAK
jgi:hypothetical protein